MVKYLRSILLVALMTTSLSALADSVAIVRAQQRYPWNGKVDIDCSFSKLSDVRSYFVEFNVSGGMKSVTWTNRVTVSSGVERFVWDAANVGNFGKEFAANCTLRANLLSVPKGDVDTGLNFQSGDYLIWDIANHSLTEVKSVTDGTVYNTSEYKTTKAVFRKIPAGTFYMGGTTNDDGPDPGVLIRLSRDYWMGIFALTVAQYQTIVGGSSASEYPLVQSWNSTRGDSSVYNWPTVTSVDPNSFVAKARALLPVDFEIDLPTYAQWERACRAGTRTRCYWGEASLYDYAWCKSISGGSTHPVGQKIPNAWGLYDMNGNSWQWCLDWYTDAPPQAAVDPLGPVSGTYRCNPGGGSGATYGDATCASLCTGWENPSVTSWDYCPRFRLMRK